MKVLTEKQVERFVDDGFVKVEGAFSAELAARAREILWRQMGLSPDDPAGWTEPVRWANDFTGQGPFGEAMASPRLCAAFGQIVGAGRWRPRITWGNIPVRFPRLPPANDTGWHIDAGFGGDDGTWRANLASDGRALLVLGLFSDTGPDDAPTRVRVGSHLDVPPILAAAGKEGVDVFAAAEEIERASRHRPEVLATGGAGDVYLCHPFLVHAAQGHRGTRVRFLAQPPLEPAAPLDPGRPAADLSPVERAIRRSLRVE
ncbi:phytanoyl-CoA dioxygenase family protein [Sinosporangium siamense]|uniref:phytanoyl-CoA dioxygenase family protein n=1 Tax=Sinosporangium siamense TaxID=1367973 RepID=UPI001EF31CE5|nr:phytanoyl-CoA dioxygenase family protein [Sinosporangium siamense]